MQSIYSHLVHRNIDPERPGIHIDELNRVATFYLYNMSGQIVGYQQYRPDMDKIKKNDEAKGRYYTRVRDEGCSKAIALYGVETLNRIKGFARPKPVFLLEGIFDAAVLHYHGFPALGVLGNDPKNLIPFLNAFHVPKIALCDSGAAGKALAKYADISFTLPDGHDLSSLAESDWEGCGDYLAGVIGMAYLRV